MPPALSDSESDAGVAAIPTRPAPANGSAGPKIVGGPDAVIDDEDLPESEREEDNEDEDGEEEEDDVFVVEAIKKHMVDEAGILQFQVKWEGYEKKADMTWEPEENLEEDASEVLKEYFAKVGGRDAILEQHEKATKGKKRGRQSVGPSTSKRSKREAHPDEEDAPASKPKSFVPPAGSWEDEVVSIDAADEDGNGTLTIFLNWQNGAKTKHPPSVVYKRCPQKMLRFYERHVKIVTTMKNEAEEKVQTLTKAEDEN